MKSKSFYTIRVSKAMPLCCDYTRAQRMEMYLYVDRTCQIHEDKVKTAEELLRSRELAVKTMEETHDQRLRNELSRY